MSLIFYNFENWEYLFPELFFYIILKYVYLFWFFLDIFSGIYDYIKELSLDYLTSGGNCNDNC